MEAGIDHTDHTDHLSGVWRVPPPYFSRSCQVCISYEPFFVCVVWLANGTEGAGHPAISLITSQYYRRSLPAVEETSFWHSSDVVCVILRVIVQYAHMNTYAVQIMDESTCVLRRSTSSANWPTRILEPCSGHERCSPFFVHRRCN